MTYTDSWHTPANTHTHQRSTNALPHPMHGGATTKNRRKGKKGCPTGRTSNAHPSADADTERGRDVPGSGKFSVCCEMFDIVAYELSIVLTIVLSAAGVVVVADALFQIFQPTTTTATAAAAGMNHARTYFPTNIHTRTYTQCELN